MAIPAGGVGTNEENGMDGDPTRPMDEDDGAGRAHAPSLVRGEDGTKAQRSADDE